jgi:hypothetical protein
VPFHEEYSYVLDAFPMMLAILVLAIIHPGRTLIGPESEFTRISRKERKAAKKEKKAAKVEEKAAKKKQKQAKKEGRRSEKTVSPIEKRERDVLDV